MVQPSRGEPRRVGEVRDDNASGGNVQRRHYVAGDHGGENIARDGETPGFGGFGAAEGSEGFGIGSRKRDTLDQNETAGRSASPGEGERLGAAYGGKGCMFVPYKRIVGVNCRFGA